ncbi:hypothetical protein LTR15_002794 [Elasticomyces elasticus]|nr:hypothetical protein LTR15_002794 [Elasticomyces elasticus]
MAASYYDLRHKQRNALLLYTSDEPRFHEGLKLLARALRDLGINVLQQELEPNGDHNSSMRRITSWVKRNDGRGNQLLLGYFGHGGKLNGRLIGAQHDLTSIQEYLRDRCEADVLFILNTCYAGTQLGAAPRNHNTFGNRVVETIAVCDGRTLGRGNNRGSARWLERLVRQLAGITPGDAMLVKQVSSAIRRERHVGKTGFLGHQSFYRRESGAGSMTLMNISK